VVSGAQLSVPKSQREIPLWRASTTCLPCRSRIRTPETLSAITSRRGAGAFGRSGTAARHGTSPRSNRPCEPSLAQLDGAYEGSRSFRGAVGEREVERTISRWMKRASRDPEPAKRWLAFLRNHGEAIAAMDLFTVPTITFGVLYCLFVRATAAKSVSL
jgi:hypothetical protein